MPFFSKLHNPPLNQIVEHFWETGLYGTKHTETSSSVSKELRAIQTPERTVSFENNHYSVKDQPTFANQ